MGTINSKTLGKIQSIKNTLTANLIPLPTPKTESDQTKVFDVFGRMRFIDIRGVFSGLTATIKGYIDDIESLIGDEQVSYTLSTTELGDKEVKIASFTSNWDVSGVSVRAEYELQCIEGKD